jgi:hypothetical protein
VAAVSNRQAPTIQEAGQGNLPGFFVYSQCPEIKRQNIIPIIQVE